MYRSLLMLLLITALDNLLINRWDAQSFARKAYDNGIRYIGGCCGFEPYHIRAMAEEVKKSFLKSDIEIGQVGLSLS